MKKLGLRKGRRTVLLLLLTVCVLSFGTGCVSQHPEGDSAGAGSEEQRIVATSNSTLWICDALDLDLTAICATSGDVPERYRGLPEIGTAMSPDAEAIALLDPTDVIGPASLRESIEPTYQAAGVPYTFIDLESVGSMYDAIDMLGEKYDRKPQADGLIEEYHRTLEDFQEAVKGKEAPKVLMLMGLPGQYIEVTQNAYCGSLLDLAGAVNVVRVDDEQNFASWNVEDLLNLDPDYILLTAHGLPDAAMEMFEKEFSTNDIWQHFRAVQENHVYQLDYSLFGMSCTFDWPKALNTLKEILYDGTADAYDAAGAYHES